MVFSLRITNSNIMNMRCNNPIVIVEKRKYCVKIRCLLWNAMSSSSLSLGRLFMYSLCADVIILRMKEIIKKIEAKTEYVKTLSSSDSG
jgi:hypothetical protein